MRHIVSRSKCIWLSALLIGTLAVSANVSYSWALTSVDNLSGDGPSDVNDNHWAAEAVNNLCQKYRVACGYPDGTFRGDRTPTRWELTAAIQQLIKAIGADLSALDRDKATREDYQTLLRLQQQMQEELGVLSHHNEQLTARIEAFEAKDSEQDKRLSLLEKTAVHGDFVMGMLGDNGRGGIGNSSSNGNGIRDSIGTFGRLRLTLDVPIREDNPESKFGAGTLSTRIIAAFGRQARTSLSEGNTSSANYPFNIYSRVTADVGLVHNEGLASGTMTNSSQTRAWPFVETLFYKQHIKPGVPLLTDWTMGVDSDRASKKNWETSGDLYAGQIRWWDLFDISPYRGNEVTQFQNNAFINIPGISVNMSMPGVAYQWHQGLGKYASADIGTMVASIDTNDFMDGMNVTYEGRLNYNTGFLSEKWAKPGSLYAGGYHIFSAGATDFRNNLSTLTNRSGNPYSNIHSNQPGSAVYVGWNQEWYKGIGTSVGYLLNNRSPMHTAFTTIQPGPAAVFAGARQTMSAVLNVPMSAFGDCIRPDDNFGIGYAFSDISEGGSTGKQFSDGFEHVGELYYRWKLNDAMSLIPSFQMITNPLGMTKNGVITVWSLRFSTTF